MNIDYIRENYMTAPQAAEYLGITRNRVGRLCLEGRFNGAGKVGDTWLIPRESVETHTRLRPGGLAVKKVIAQYEQVSNLCDEMTEDYNNPSDEIEEDEEDDEFMQLLAKTSQYQLDMMLQEDAEREWNKKKGGGADGSK